MADVQVRTWLGRIALLGGGAIVGLAGCPSAPNPDVVEAGADARDAVFFDRQDVTTADVAEDVEQDAAMDVQPEDAADAGDGSMPPTMAHLRFAYVAAAQGTGPRPPTFDVCIRPAGMPTGMFTGPLFEMHGLMAGLAWDQVSAYIDIAPGNYDLRFVAPDTSDCNAMSVVDVLPPLMAAVNVSGGAFQTVVLHGVLAAPDGGTSPAPFRATLLTDRDPGVRMGVHLRLFDALPAPPPLDALDVGIVTPGPPETFTTIFENVRYGQLGNGPMGAMYPMGYFPGTPFDSVTVGARQTCAGTPPCTNTILLRATISIPANTTFTAFLATVDRMGNAVPGAMVCIDSAPAMSGLTNCVVPPQM